MRASKVVRTFNKLIQQTGDITSKTKITTKVNAKKCEPEQIVAEVRRSFKFKLATLQSDEIATSKAGELDKRANTFNVERTTGRVTNDVQVSRWVSRRVLSVRHSCERGVKKIPEL